MTEKQMTPESSLALIQSMIDKAKANIADKGFYFILWGWLVFCAAMFQYISIKVHFPYGGLAWLLMPVGAVVTVIYGIRQNKSERERPRTYIEGFLRYLWLGFGIGLTLVLLTSGIHGIKATYFFLMILYGLGTFVSGGALSFPPLIMGGLFSFTCAVMSVFLGDEEQLLCLSAALLLSYIVPGHMLRNRHK